MGRPVRVRVRDAGDRERDRARSPKARGRVTQHESDPRAGSGQGAASLKTPQPVQPWAVEGPVQAEVFVLRMRPGRPELAGPGGPDPWYIRVAAEEDPGGAGGRLSRSLRGEPGLG